MANNERTTVKEKLIYGSASIADSVCYGFVGTFGMFFLTTVAGIDPAPAGTIVAIGTIWNAIFTPISVTSPTDIIRSTETAAD